MNPYSEIREFKLIQASVIVIFLYETVQLRVGDITVSAIAVPRLIRVFNEFQWLGAALLWAAPRDEVVMGEHRAGIGRRRAIERMAYFILELGQYRQSVGMAKDTKFECPLSQYLLADSLGLTAIHTNRILRQLREQGLITLEAHHVIVDDVKGLRKLAGFDSGQLDQPRPLVKIDD